MRFLGSIARQPCSNLQSAESTVLKSLETRKIKKRSDFSQFWSDFFILR